jgi:hypothetical protein
MIQRLAMQPVWVMAAAWQLLANTSQWKHKKTI